MTSEAHSDGLFCAENIFSAYPILRFAVTFYLLYLLYLLHHISEKFLICEL